MCLLACSSWFETQIYEALEEKLKNTGNILIT